MPACRSQTTVERRKTIRFNLPATVIYRWEDLSGQQQVSIGDTRDISISGAFVVCFRLPTVGTIVSLEVHLPAVEQNVVRQMTLQAEARVIRTSDTTADRGFAVTSHFELERLSS